MKNGIIKLGIIGTNFISDWMCENVAVSSCIVNYAVYSRTWERGEAFAKKHGIEHVFTSYEDFLSSGIDAVYVASPNALHFSQAMAAIEHGLHAIVEKPAGLNELEFASLEEAAKRRGVIFMEAMRPAHDPAMGIICDAVGSLGMIRRATLEFCQYSSRYDKFKAGIPVNTFDPGLGNAAIMDIGIYPMYCAAVIFGKPNKMSASSVILSNGMEGLGSVIMDYGTHQVEVLYSKITDSVSPSVIMGEEGSLLIGKLNTLEHVGLHMRDCKYEPLIENRTEHNMLYEIANFVRAVRGEFDLTQYLRMSRLTVSLIDEARRQSGISFPTEMR